MPGAPALHESAVQIVVLERGQVVEAGPHSQLLQKGGLYSRMWAQASVDDSRPPDEDKPAASATRQA